MENLGYKILVSIPGYEILHELGRGGMATVYLAVQESLQRQLALKVMSPTLSVDPSFKDRFMREGRTLGQLTHPNIVTIYDIGVSASRYFIAMEYVAGSTLAERIDNGLSTDHSARIIKDIARALHYAHRRGFVHRDVKPSNILFRDDDTPVLADFGIARPVDAATRLTKTGLSVGTPNYMSPEQVSGHKLDGRSDLYSLGIVFYEMLTGKPPYHGESAIATSLKHLTEPVPKLPPELMYLQPVMERMLAKAADDRFSDLQEFIESLDSAIAARDRDRPPGKQSELSRKTLFYDETRDKQPERAGEQQLPSGAELPQSNLGVGIPRASAWVAAFKSHRNWQWSVGLAALAVLAAVAALLVKPDPIVPPRFENWVDERLRAAEEQRNDGHLVDPEGNNAFETYQEVLEFFPDYPKALDGVQEVAEQFAEQANDKASTGDLAASLALLDRGLKVAAQGLAFNGEHEGLSELRVKLTQQVEGVRRQQQIKAALANGDRQFSDWNLVEPAGDNAAESYRAVLKLESKNPRALQGLKRIASRLQGLALTKQSAGDLNGALEDVNKAIGVDPQRGELRALRESLTREISVLERHEKVAKLLKKAEQQLRDDRLVSPPGGNAFESYQEVLNAQPENEQARQARIGLNDVAARMTTLARTEQEAGRTTEALRRIDTGLRLFKGLTGYEELQALRAAIVREQRVTTLLAAAAQQLKASRLFEPGGDNALASYQEVQTLEPNNETARQGLLAIADHQEAVAARAKAAGNLNEALAAIGQGQTAVPEHQGLAVLEAAVRRALKVQEVREKRLATLVGQAEKQLAAGRLTSPAGNNAYESYREVLATDPGNEAAQRGIQTLVAELEQRARQQQSTGAIQRSLSLVEEALRVGAENRKLVPVSLRQELGQLQQALINQIETMVVERRITALLDQARTQFRADKLTTPPGDNAEESYREVLALDSGNEQAVAGRQQLVVRLAELAQHRRYAGQFDASLSFTLQGLQIAPRDATLLALKEDVERRIRTEEDITGLLEKAQRQIEANRLTEPVGDNALQSYRQVLSLQSRNERALAGLQRIADRYLQFAQRKQQQGDLETADVLVRKGLAVVPDHRELLSLQQSVQNAERDQELVALLNRAERQLENDQLTEPEGDDALGSFRAVLERSPGDQRARDGIARIAERFAALAADRSRQGELSDSLSLIGKGLAIAPKNRSLLTLQEQIQSQLEASRQREEQIAALLDKAAAMLAQDRLTAPEGDNAYDTYQQVLALDSNNQQALAGTREVVNRLAAVAEERHDGGQLGESLALIDQGLAIAPEDSALLGLKKTVAREIEAKKREQEVQELLAQAEAQLAADRLIEPEGDNAYRTFQQVLELVPGNERALIGLHRLGNDLARRAQLQLDSGNPQEAQALVEQLEVVSPWHPNLADLKKTIASKSGEAPSASGPVAKLLAKAQQQIASLKLTRPAGDNAYETLQAVLAIDPDNSDAKAALSSIADRYAALGRRRLQAGNRREARAMVERGLGLDPQHRDLLAMKDELTRAREAPAATLASLLAKAEQQLSAGRATKPPGDNAYETLQEALRREPGNRDARAGLRTIAAQYEVSIKGQLAKGDPQKASALLAEARKVFPEHKGLASLDRDLSRFAKGPEVKALIGKAEQQLKSEDWTQPPGNNAFETLQEVLRIDPKSRQAQNLLRSIPTRCEKRARATQQQGNTTSALSSVEECLRFFPRDAGLIALRDEMKRPREEQPTPISAFEETPTDARQEEPEERRPKRRRVFGTF